jgi:hypothetical protein
MQPANRRGARPARRLLLASVVLAGCGGNVVVDGTSGTTTTASTTTGTTFTTGTTGTTGTTTIGTTTIGTTTTVPFACGGGSISLAVDSGPMSELPWICNDPPWNPGQSTTPIGYLVQGGPPPGVSIFNLLGCMTNAPGARGIHVQAQNVMGSGNFNDVSVTYDDGNGTTFTSVAGKSELELNLVPLGLWLTGSFDSLVAAGGQSHWVSGGFNVCHAPDEQLP